MKRYFKGFILLCIIITLFTLVSKENSVQGDNSTVFFFHNRSEIYHNENRSLFIYDGAYAESPIGIEESIAVVKCEIMQDLQYSIFVIRAYAGLVSWVTPPLSQDYAVNGIMTFHVWMSSDDFDASGTGYAFTVAELDENDNIIAEEFYEFTYQSGNILSTEPTECILSVAVNHVFKANHKLAFQAIVGSATQGWIANIYFNSVDRNSRVELPGNPVVIPEFKDVILGLVFSILILSFFIKKRNHKC